MPDSPITLETIHALLMTYLERLDAIDEKQAIANGRVGKLEQAMAVVKAVGVLGMAAVGAWLSKVL